MNLRTQERFYQWDTGRFLTLEGEEVCTQVHFCYTGDENALVCPVREDRGKRVVEVPNILLQQPKQITAYLMAVNEAGEYTRWENTFPVLPRPKPEDYVYTQTEILNFTRLDKRLENLEGEGIRNAVTDFLQQNPIAGGATPEQAEQIRQNGEEIARLSREKLSLSGGTMTGKILFPTGNQNVGFANSEDMKIFGYGMLNGAVYMRIGDTAYPFQIRGKGTRPQYNDGEVAMMGDIPTDGHINGLIHTALGVIEHGTY